MPECSDIIIVETTGETGQMTFQGGSGAVHRSSSVPIRPGEHDAKHPCLSLPITPPGRSIPVIHDRQPLTTGAIGHPG